MYWCLQKHLSCKERSERIHGVFICPTCSSLHQTGLTKRVEPEGTFLPSFPPPPCDLSVFVPISVLSVSVCEAWLFWFPEKHCWMSVSLRRAGRLPGPPPLHEHGHGYAPITVPGLVPVMEFAPTNRPLNFTHVQRIQKWEKIKRADRCFLPLSKCVSRHNTNRTTFGSSPIHRKPVGFPGASEMPTRQMDMRDPQSDPTLGSK